MFLTGKTDGYTSILTKFKKTDNKHHRLSVSFFDYFKKKSSMPTTHMMISSSYLQVIIKWG